MSTRPRLAVAALGAAAALVAAASPASAAPSDGNGPLLTYVVNVKSNTASLRDASDAITAHGGAVVAAYRKIGVIVARSTNAGFAAELRALDPKDSRIQSVGSTRTVGITTAGTTDVAATRINVPDPGESPTALYDMALIKADQAHATTLGSRRVTVGVLDDGVDDTHPDLAGQVLTGESASCLSGAPDTTFGSWRPFAGEYHGTHVAGTIAAKANGQGIVGVAPGVKLASVKVVNADGFIYPEAAVCGFVWAGEHGFDVTNNSYYIDPWLFYCSDDPDQAAAKEAVLRAIGYSKSQGVLSVAAAGNEDYDLANKTVDTTSPDDGAVVTRPITNDCLSLPTEAPGVVIVASVTRTSAKSSFSNYGLGKIDVAAPGSSIISTFPLDVSPSGYGQISGTSMASPHVAGVAALLKSTHPKASPDELLGLLRAQADPLACPTTGAAAVECTGTTAHNSLFGFGLVDALDAVS